MKFPSDERTLVHASWFRRKKSSDHAISLFLTSFFSLLFVDFSFLSFFLIILLWGFFVFKLFLSEACGFFGFLAKDFFLNFFFSAFFSDFFASAVLAVLDSVSCSLISDAAPMVSAKKGNQIFMN